MMPAAERLGALVAQCGAAGARRQVLLLRAARLPPALSRPHHLRLAEAALAPLLAASRAELFRLPGASLAIGWRGDAEGALLDAAARLGHLLADGPPGTPALPDLLSLFDLPDDGSLLLDAIRPAHPVSALADARTPLDAAALVGLEARLAQADVSRFVRRRPVWRLTDTGAVPAWEKRTLSVAELAASLAPGHDLRVEPWLFRRLTRTLDRRMLALLASKGELAAARPFSLDLNVSSILGAEFLRFDGALPPSLRGRLLIELMPADVMADPAAFVFARGFVRTRGYRLLLRCPSAELLPVLRADAFEVDYLELPWSGALGNAPCPTAAPQRLVLTGADGAAALAWARQAGLRLVSGRAVSRDGVGEAGAAA